MLQLLELDGVYVSYGFPNDMLVEPETPWKSRASFENSRPHQHQRFHADNRASSAVSHTQSTVASPTVGRFRLEAGRR
jgi:hypothetical protein